MMKKQAFGGIFFPLRLLTIIVIAISLLQPCFVQAQKRSPHDTSFYTDYPGTVTARVYFAQKYSPFTIPSSVSGQDLRYTPNTKLNMGIGATYNNFSLNLGYGFGFLNHDEEKGKTKGLDIQLHLYPHKWAVDALGIFHKGNHIDPAGYAAPTSTSYYYRPDVKLDLMGLAVYRVPNAEKFSYRAAMIQNEWQKRSAGSVLYGGMAHYGILKGDSALVPTEVAKGFLQSGIDNIHFFSAGAGLGYAYTMVIEKHFFVTGSLIGNLAVNLTSEEGVNGKNNKVSASPSAIYKAAVGYNSSTWDISANCAGNAMLIKGAASPDSYFFPTGTFRVILAKKILLKRNKHSRDQL